VLPRLLTLDAPYVLRGSSLSFAASHPLRTAGAVTDDQRENLPAGRSVFLACVMAIAGLSLQQWPARINSPMKVVAFEQDQPEKGPLLLAALS
jgi:hypothetical protein